jgi:hypothetical protein
MRVLTMLLVLLSGFAAGCPKPASEVRLAEPTLDCELPAPPRLPAVDLVGPGEAGCPAGFSVCLDGANAARLEQRELRMRSWIRNAIASCSDANDAGVVIFRGDVVVFDMGASPTDAGGR